MICKVKNTINKFNLLTEEIKSVAVGISGGADSVCLLKVLNLLKCEYDIIIKAVHINHNIRGEEALRDENFVRELCLNLGIELMVFSIDVPSLAKKEKLSLEECGRKVRYECFSKADCDAVAVAHTLSDSIETMLFNLARGTGTKGLGGIPPKREPNIIRPLIECTRGEIEAYCRDNKLNFVNDSTNESDDYTRNFIRHNLVPCFSKINGGFEKSFLRSMENVRSEDAFLEKEARKLLESAKLLEGYSLKIIKSADDVIIKRCLSLILKENMVKPFENKHIELVFDCVKKENGKVELNKGLYISVKSDIISIHKSVKSELMEKTPFINSKALTSYGSFVLSNVSVICENCFDGDKIKDELYISSRLPGDSFTFSRRKVTKSLKKLFNELKVPEEKRNTLAVLRSGDSVIWVEGVGVNAYYLPNEKTKNIIMIKKDG